MKKTVTYVLCTVALLAALAGCSRSDKGKVTPAPTNNVITTNSPMISPNVSDDPDTSPVIPSDIIPSDIVSPMPSDNVSAAPRGSKK